MLTLGQYNPKGYNLTAKQVENASDLLKAVNGFLSEYGVYPAITSGVRTWEDHLRIYDEINTRRVSLGYDPLRIPTRSNHLITYKNDAGDVVSNERGATAIDLADRTKGLWYWTMKNLNLLEKYGLYAELRMGNWLHLQTVRPISGNRIFKP